MTSVFDELIGQERVIEILKGAVIASRIPNESNKMTHAWLFTGPPGSGRSSAALAFAQALICPEYGCGTCNDCNSAKTHGHPDVDIISTEGLSIKVEEVRELLNRVAWTPTLGGWRVVVMEDADRLTESAANAILKAIEEPGTRTVWLLCAPTLHDVLPTVRSRCRHLQLCTPSLDEVTNLLINRDQIEREMAELAARVNQGHIGRAKYFATVENARSNRKKFLQIPLQLTSLARALHTAQTLVDLATSEANALSGERDEQEIEKLQFAYGKGETGRGLATGGAKAIKELEKEQKYRATRVVRDLIDGALLVIVSFYRDVMMVQCGNRDSIVNSDLREQIESYATKSSSYVILNKINAIMEARNNLARNALPLVTCEALMCQLSRK